MPVKNVCPWQRFHCEMLSVMAYKLPSSQGSMFPLVFWLRRQTLRMVLCHVASAGDRTNHGHAAGVS